MRELDGIDFDAQPSLDQERFRELATCRWIAHGDTLLLLRPPGMGKTRLAVTLGREANGQSCNVQFITAATLVATLAKARSDGLLDKQLTLLSRPKPLIIDERGYLRFEANAAHLFFQLVSRRYEKGSIQITSNRSVGEWGASETQSCGVSRKSAYFDLRPVLLRFHDFRRLFPSTPSPLGSTRSVPACTMTGEATAIAATLAAKRYVPNSAIAASEVQARLKKLGDLARDPGRRRSRCP